MPDLALIGLGSNLGDRKPHLDFAVAALSNAPGVTVRAVSTYHETPPVGGPGGQGAFLNAAAVLETALEPEPLLDLLNAVEDRFGRVRSVRWGERTLDLDLLLYGDRILHTPRLTVPHPRMALRRFVLAPLAEVAHAAADPLTGRTVADLLANLDRRPSYVALHGPDGPVKDAVLDGISWGLVARVISDATPWAASHTTPDPDPVIRFAGRILGRSQGTKASSWPAEVFDWLVSGFCLPLDLAAWTRMLTVLGFRHREALRFSPRQRRAFDPEAVERAAEGTLRPTFAVILGGAPPPTLPGGPWPVPLLFPGSDDPEAIVAEVLAACAATRAG